MEDFLNVAFSEQGRTFSFSDKVSYPSSEAYLDVFRVIRNQYVDFK